MNPQCGLEYTITSGVLECEKGHLLDVIYNKIPSRALKELFLSRRNPQGSIFNESGVWRFRELLNFCQIDTGNLDECSKHLVSLDGAEGDSRVRMATAPSAEFMINFALSLNLNEEIEYLTQQTKTFHQELKRLKKYYHTL